MKTGKILFVIAMVVLMIGLSSFASASLNARSTPNASIRFNATVYNLNLDSASVIIKIHVNDTSLNTTNGPDNVSVYINSTTFGGSGNFITILLNESINSTGYFNVSMNYSIDAADPDVETNRTILLGLKSALSSNLTLNVTAGDRIMAWYASGDGNNYSDTAYIDQAATIAFDNGSYSLKDGPNVTITDCGFNTNISSVNNISINVSSDLAIGGILVQLNESGVDTCKFSVYTLSVRDDETGLNSLNLNFSDTATDDAVNMLQVQAGSRVVVNFSDAINTDKNLSGEIVGSYDTAYMDMNAIVNITQGGNSVKRSSCGVPCEGGNRSNLAQAYVGNISVVVNDTGSNINHLAIDTINVTLISSDGKETIKIGLNESGADTGKFNITMNVSGGGTADVYDSVRITLDLIASNNRSLYLKVAEGGQVNLSYSDNNNFSDYAAFTKIQSMNLYDNGTIEFNNINPIRAYQSNSTVTLTVRDTDLNYDPAEYDTANATLYNLGLDSGVEYFVVLNESGKDTGIFNGTLNATLNTRSITFKVNITTDDINSNLSSNLTVNITGDGGDLLKANYTDNSTLLANITVSEFAKLEQSSNITINLTTVKPIVFAPNDDINITVVDNGSNINRTLVEQINVSVGSPNSAGFILILNESSADSGVFSITVNRSAPYNANTLSVVTSGASTDFYDILVAEHGNITVYYLDTNLSGQIVNKTTGGNISTTGYVYLNTTVFAASEHVKVNVLDQDNNTDPSNYEIIKVTFYSDSDSGGGGVNLSLNESGINTGLFNVPLNSSIRYINFSWTVSDNRSLLINEGDKLYVNYSDTVPAAVRTLNTSGRIEQTATAVIEFAGYNITADDINITVTDMGGNTNESALDTVNVVLICSGGSGSINQSVNVTLNESDLDTGTFYIEHSVSVTNTTASSDSTDTVQCGAGGRLYVNYTDNKNVNGTLYAYVQDYANIFGNATTLAFTNSKVAYNATDGINITVTDRDENIDWGVSDTIQIRLVSTNDTKGIWIVLNETDVDSGIFNITNGTGSDISLSDDGITNESGSVNQLGVQEGDTLVVVYPDQNDTNGDMRWNITDVAVVNTQAALLQGWDLISTPYSLETYKRNVSLLFEDVDVNYTGTSYDILWWNGSQWANSLGASSNIEPLKAYWIQTTGSRRTVTFQPKYGGLGASHGWPDQAPSNTQGYENSLALAAGYWNLIGPNKIPDVGVDTIFGSLLNDTNLARRRWRIQEYDTNQVSATEAALSTYYLKNTSGYLLWVPADMTGINYQGFNVR